MTKTEVVKAVRDYTKKELEAQNLDLDGLNVSHLNDLIKATLNDIVQECEEGEFNKRGYSE